MAAPQERDLGFSFSASEDKVFISYHGRGVMILKGAKALAALARLNRANPAEAQLILAKLTGNFKRGNERSAAHPDH